MTQVGPAGGLRGVGGSRRQAGVDGEANRFRILKPHARGGLGQVFLAHDEELNRAVALKEILGRHADHEDSRARFLIEAEVTGGLEHPGIVPVYGLGQYPDGHPYYAMRFIRGESMQEAIDRHHYTASAAKTPAVTPVVPDGAISRRRAGADSFLRRTRARFTTRRRINPQTSVM